MVNATSRQSEDVGVGRGDRHRLEIQRAVRDLLVDVPLADVTVSAITRRVGLSRSNFYFYYESKYAVLAAIVSDCLNELDRATANFAPRADDEAPAIFVARMIGTAAAIYATQRPALSACTLQRNSDPELLIVLVTHIDRVVDKITTMLTAEVTRGSAAPICGDVAMLVRTLVVTTAHVLAGDTAYLGDGDDPRRSVVVLEALWLGAFWPAPN